MVHSGLSLYQVELQAISKLESLPKIQEWVSKMDQWKRFQSMEKLGPAWAPEWNQAFNSAVKVPVGWVSWADLLAKRKSQKHAH